MAENSIILAAAMAAHEANRAWCFAHNDLSQLHWENAPPWQKESAIKGVMGVLEGNGPEEAHHSWLKEKEATGWKYGPEKDPEKKEHPCMVPYDELPPDQTAKDDIFVATVRAVLLAGGMTIQGMAPRPKSFREELTALINSYSKEKESNTPDFILSHFLIGCLNSFGDAVQHREAWYGRGGLSAPDREAVPLEDPTVTTVHVPQGENGFTFEEFSKAAKLALDSLLGSIRAKNGFVQDVVGMSSTRNLDKIPVSIIGSEVRFVERGSTLTLTVNRNPPIDL